MEITIVTSNPIVQVTETVVNVEIVATPINVDLGAAGLPGPTGPAGAAAVWGNITGTLSNQLDLQAALDDKLSAVRTDGAIIVGDGTLADPLTLSTSAYSVLSNNTATPGTPTNNQFLILGTPTFVATGNMGQITGDKEGVTQFVIQNTSRGSTSSIGFVVENDNGTDSTNFGEFGINSSVYTGTGALNAANAVFIHASSSPIVLNSSGGEGAIRMTISGAATDGLRLDTSGVGINTNTATARLDFVSSSLGASPTVANGVLIQNTTVAAAGAQQWSPLFTLRGNGFKSNATAASQPVDGRMVVVPVQGTTAPTGSIQFGLSINGGAFGTSLTIGSDLSVTAGGNLYSTGMLASSPTTTSANFWCLAATSIATTNLASLLFGGASNIQTRTTFGGTAGSLSVGVSYANVIFGRTTNTEAASGTHGVLANAAVLAPVFTNGGAASTDITTFYIEGAPTGTATSTNGNLALLVDSGNIRVDGNSGFGRVPVSTSFVALGAATTAKSSMNIAAGTAPTSPVDGDLWYDGTDVKIRVSGTTKTFTIL